MIFTSAIAGNRIGRLSTNMGTASGEVERPLRQTWRQPLRWTGSMYIIGTRPTGRTVMRLEAMSHRVDEISTWMPFSVSDRMSRLELPTSIAVAATMTLLTPMRSARSMHALGIAEHARTGTHPVLAWRRSSMKPSKR